MFQYGTQMNTSEARHTKGFSIIELLFVISVTFIVAGMAVLSMNSAIWSMKVNGSLNQLVGQMRTARDSAIAQRRNFQVVFVTPDQIQLRRQELPAGFTDLPVVSLGGGAQFTVFSGVPDTPDGFGNATAINFGGSPTLTFLSDGTLVDSTGTALNGSIFIGIPGKPDTARAVTILGATGRVRGYHWTGSKWIE